MGNFCRDLCDGLVGNCRNCMTTPITRTKIYWVGGVTLGVILFIVILCVAIPGGGGSSGGTSPSGKDALDQGLTQGLFLLPAGTSEKTDVSKFDKTLLDPILKNKFVRLQMFGAKVSCESQYKDAVQLALDQVDYLSRLAATISPLTKVGSSGDYESAHSMGRIAVLPVLVGGQAIDSRLAVLRSLHSLGVRMVTLVTDGCSTPWAKAANDKTKMTTPLTDFGKAIVKEMNRLGMLIDIGGADSDTQAAILDASAAPVMAVGIGLKSVNNNPLNMDSNVVLKKFVDNKGVLLISTDCALITQNSSTTCNQNDFMSILKLAQSQKISVGIGPNLNSGTTPADLSPDKIPDFFDFLFRNGFDMDFLRGFAGENFLRAWKAVETKAAELSKTTSEDIFFDRNASKEKACYSDVTTDPTQAPTTAPTKAPTTAPTHAP